jgi:hypothetical protein
MDICAIIRPLDARVLVDHGLDEPGGVECPLAMGCDEERSILVVLEKGLEGAFDVPVSHLACLYEVGGERELIQTKCNACRSQLDGNIWDEHAGLNTPFDPGSNRFVRGTRALGLQ